jgi:cellulose synthase/poly-beta-1,6-N-acetylglucosamine synthase-like glycosyltransferase
VLPSLTLSMNLLGLTVALLQLALWLLLAAACVHLVRCALWGWNRPLGDGLLTPREGDLPQVTVQLPLRNEVAVAERLLRAVAALDWPRDRLQIQVLEDSDDETSPLVDKVAAELAADGAPIEVVRRTDRAGFKAGNLQNGLGTARGEFLLVLDADSLPPADLIRRLATPLIADGRVAFSQARWSYENETAGLLTRLQAMILDGLMLVEQPRLSALGLPLPFNGTAGLWRRSALEAAGGWLPAGGPSVTEDLDLAYRAQLAGFRGVALPEVAVVTQLPPTMAAFRAQQARWVRGGGQVLRGLFRRVMRAGSTRERAAMLGHLARHARQPMLLAATFWLPVALFGLRSPLAPTGTWPSILLALHASVAFYYATARQRKGASPLLAIVLAPLVVALSMGMSLFLTIAFLRGLFGREAEFVRTPKGGKYRAAVSSLAFAEVAIGLLYLRFSTLAGERGEWPTALALAFFLAGGYLWVGIGSLADR